MGGLIAVGFIVLFAILVGLAVVATRKQASARRQRMLDIGFAPVEPPDPELVERVTVLRRRRSPKGTRVTNVFRKEGDGYRLYVLDAVSVGSDEDSTSQENVVLISPHLRLPAFALVPKLEIGGFVAAAANQLLARLLSRAMPAVEVPTHPEFTRRYSLFGDSPEEVRSALTDEALTHLAETGGCALEAHGDTLVVGRLPMGGKGAGPAEGQLEESLREAVILFDLLRED